LKNKFWYIIRFFLDAVNTEKVLTFLRKYVNLFKVKGIEGEFWFKNRLQRAVGWCKAAEVWIDCRPGARFLNSSREMRVSPLQRLSARNSGKSGGTAEVFALKSLRLQAFLFPS